MDEFTIYTSGGYSLRFHSSERDAKGWLEYFSVTLQSPQANGTYTVYYPPYGKPINGFFERLAKDWRGLRDKLHWESMEGELSLSAESDSTGHTYLVAIAYSHVSFEPPMSELKVCYVIEAGQLAKLLVDAEKFFK
jgi:Family of unknown function (DUF6228)